MGEAKEKKPNWEKEVELGVGGLGLGLEAQAGESVKERGGEVGEKLLDRAARTGPTSACEKVREEKWMQDGLGAGKLLGCWYGENRQIESNWSSSPKFIYFTSTCKLYKIHITYS